VAIAGLPGVDARRPDVDLRHDVVTIRLVTVREDLFGPTAADVAMARRISELAGDHGLVADPSALQSLLVIPGASDTAAIMPFWEAVLGYVRRPDAPDEDMIDPRRRGTSFWFERMDQPRGDGGGAIHIAVWVPEEEAEARVAAALAAGGRIVRDEFAPAWWTLADAAGNEADIATIKSRS
jgi:4a-hydroxytetrahydrobiopterin dehydratase